MSCLRKRILLFLLSLFLVQNNGFCDKPTIGVVAFENRVGWQAREVVGILNNSIMNALFETGKVRLVERSRLGDLTDEQLRGLWGQTDPKSSVEAGKMLGAQVLAIGSLTKFEEKKPM